MTDGNRAREPLAALLGTMSLGEVSVGCFFLLSGYLIAGSWQRLGAFKTFIFHRVLRIYPAFLLAYTLSVVLLGTAVGAAVDTRIPEAIARALVLHGPMQYPSELQPLLHHPDLNKAMWTISYEFRCYMLTAALGVAGLLSRRSVVLLLTCLALTVFGMTQFGVGWSQLTTIGSSAAVQFLVGEPVETIRLTSIYLVGTCFGLYWSDIAPRLDWKLALACAAVAVALMNGNPVLAQLGFATFGAVTLFWLALKADFGPVQRINDRWDISYGTYLYGWPIATALLYAHPSLSPWLLAACAVPLAWAAGAASWFGLESHL